MLWRNLMQVMSGARYEVEAEKRHGRESDTAAEIRRELEGRHHSDSTGQVLCDFDEILSAALSLPPGARAMLADHLLVSLDSPNQEQIDAAWAPEIEVRIHEIDEGKVETIDGETVMRELRTRL